MSKAIIVLSMLVCSITSAVAEVSVSIGINIPVFPQLVVIPGYPVYYAPQLSANYFFYDGMYWIFVNDNWYTSAWYNGPWELVAPEFVPVFLLRVPVRYYRRPPVYFSAWYASAPPHWGEHWGYGWEQQHRGWDTWNRAAVPAPAPLPVYQRQYTGTRYPRVEQQYALQSQNYRYHPRDALVQQHYQRAQTAAAPVQRAPAQQSAQRTPAQQSTAPSRGQPSQAERREAQRTTVAPPPARQAAAPTRPSQAERRETQRTTVEPPPTRQAAAPTPRSQPPQAERGQRPTTASAPQAAVPPPRAQPQPTERREVQRTASAPPPMQLPQRQAVVPPEQPPQAKATQTAGAP